MLSTIKTYLANQARKPSGWFGRVIAPRVFNRENREMEDYGLKLMDPDEDDRILEIGFGNGRLISEIMPHIENGKVHGIDISGEMISLASKRNRQWIEEGTLEIKKGSIGNIPYPDGYFDKIFTANTIYFWPDPKENLCNVLRALKPEGNFLCAMRTRQQMESMNSVVRDNRGVFQNLYRAEEVKQLFKEAGFRYVNHHMKNHESEKLHVIAGNK